MLFLNRLCDRLSSRLRSSALSLAVLAAFFSPHLALAHHAEGFVDFSVPRPDGGAWNEAVGVSFQDNGRGWVWERGGTVWVLDPEQAVSSPVIDISEEVGVFADHGMLGLALDPDFANNGYLYLLYVVDRHHLFL